MLPRIEEEARRVRLDLVVRILELVNDPNEPRKDRWLQYLRKRFHPTEDSARKA